MTDQQKPKTPRRVDELNALEEGEAEIASGFSILALETDEPKAKLLAALAWVHKRRTDPKLKYGDYMKSCNTKANISYLFGNDEEDAEDAGEVQAPDDDARLLDDDGEPTDPFREAAAPEGADEGPGAVDDAEGSVLSLDRNSA